MKNKIIKLFNFILYLVLTSKIGAAGLSSTFTEVVIDNLQIGQTYSLKKIFNKPYDITFHGSRPTIIKLRVYAPSNSLRKGYEAPINVDWIKLEKTNFTATQSGETLYSDILISPPNDKTLLGKKYQVSIEAETYSGSTSMATLDYAVESYLRFSIAPIQMNMKPEEFEGLILPLNYKLNPSQIIITNLNIEETYNKKYYIGNFTIENFDEQEHIYLLKSLFPSKTGNLTIGYSDPPDLVFLSFSINPVNIAKKECKKVDVYIQFPPSGNFQGKKYQFTIGADIKSSNKSIATTLYSQIYITTKR